MMISQKLKWTPVLKQFMALYGKPFKNSLGFRRNSRLFGLLLLVCLLPVSSISYAVDTEPSSGDGDGASLTPLSEFAPDEVRPAKGEIYDQGLTINKISIEGNRLIEEDKIKDTMASRPGSLYSKRNLQQDLRRIYDMGYFTEKIKAVPIATNAGIHL
ncbi:MAG: hypothetical protein K2X66_00480, partial [Cyanobacteria bacterium]|nr:hypothetical protein [Cyanobacteriota bacterium]